MLLPAELLLLEFPPSTAPKIPATAEPALLVVLVDVAALLVVVAAVVAVVLDAAEAVFFVEVFLAVDFLELFFAVFFAVFLAVFLTGIISDIEALSAASFIALALLPAVHASTRAAKRNTFFIAFYILLLSLLFIYTNTSFSFFRVQSSQKKSGI